MKYKMRPKGNGIAWGWGAFPLYAALFIQSMPIGRPVAPVQAMYQEQAHSEIAERVTTSGLAQSALPMAIWGTLYFFALCFLLKPSSRAAVRLLIQRHWSLIALLILVVASLAWSPYPVKVGSNVVNGLGATLIAMAAAVQLSSGVPRFLRATSVALSLSLVVHLVSIAAAPAFTVATDGRWMGLTTHSNTLGSMGFIAGWASVGAWLLSRGRERIVPALCLMSALIILVGSRSMTSIAAAAIAIALQLMAVHTSGFPRSLRQLVNVAFVCTLTLSICGFWLFDSIFTEAASSVGKTSDLSGRTDIWQAAIGLIGQRPTFGWGFDDNARVIVETGLPHTGYHNGYLDIAVRGGLVALTLVVIALIVWALDYRRSRSLAWRVACAPLVVAILVHNVSEVSFFAPRNPLWILLITLMFATVLIRKSRKDGVAGINAAGHAVFQHS